MKTTGVIFALILLCELAVCQDEVGVSILHRGHSPAVQLTGNARVDLVGLREITPSPDLAAQVEGMPGPPHRSPWIAAGLSVVVPGAGEFYSESFWKAAGFFALDVAAWVFAYSYDKKGDRQTDTFQDFANHHWSVVRYANYALENLAPSDGNYAGLIKPGTENRPPWERVNWNVLNRMERDISATASGQYYSHTLPPYNDQQYYELIGKYPQFNQGWDDAASTFVYGDPLTPYFRSYSEMRGKANDYYTSASTFVTVAIINHILSAADAAWSAASFNGAHATVGMQTIPAGDHLARVPVAKLSYSF